LQVWWLGNEPGYVAGCVRVARPAAVGKMVAARRRQQRDSGGISWLGELAFSFLLVGSVNAKKVCVCVWEVESAYVLLSQVRMQQWWWSVI